MKMSSRFRLFFVLFFLVSLLSLIGFFHTTTLGMASLMWLGLFIGLIIGGLYMVWRTVQHQILRPLQILSQAITKVRLGDLTQTVPIRSHDEIGELSNNFNDMTAQLGETQRNLQRTSDLAIEHRAELESSINSLRQGFILIDTTGKVLLANGAAKNMIGASYHAHAASSTSPMLLELLGTQGAADVRFTEAITHAMTLKKQTKISDVAFNGRFINLYLSPVITAQQSIGCVLLLEDVTEERILQRSRDEFFSIASHELRTPLTAIRGNMSMVKDYYAEALADENLRSMINDTHAASVRLIEIVNDFLDSSKLEQGKMTFTFVLVPVVPLVRAVINDLQPLVASQANTIVVDPNVDALPPVWADEGRFRQILYNLLSNANKYCTNGAITLTGERKGKTVRLNVTDNGKGISSEGQKLLFHKFQQAGDSILTRDNTKGTGLGLYISRLLATSMFGDVTLEHSQEGKGSTFCVTLGTEAKPSPQVRIHNENEQ